MKLIDTQVVTTEVRISDRDLKNRLLKIVMADLGMLDDQGNPRSGVIGSVTRYGDRNNGGHAIRVTRDLSASQDKRLPAP